MEQGTGRSGRGGGIPIRINRLAYFVIETERAANGAFFACIAQEGVPGHEVMDYTWGTDLEAAREIAEKMNARMGIDKTEAAKILVSTVTQGAK